MNFKAWRIIICIRFKFILNSLPKIYTHLGFKWIEKNPSIWIRWICYALALIATCIHYTYFQFWDGWWLNAAPPSNHDFSRKKKHHSMQRGSVRCPDNKWGPFGGAGGDIFLHITQRRKNWQAHVGLRPSYPSVPCTQRFSHTLVGPTPSCSQNDRWPTPLLSSFI